MLVLKFVKNFYQVPVIDGISSQTVSQVQYVTAVTGKAHSVTVFRALTICEPAAQNWFQIQ